MQPYFFPYVGYFDVIRKTDRWVVFDVVKYRPKSWMNRNRILDVNAGHTYVTVPVHKASSQQLSEIRVVDADRAAGKILKQLQQYRPTSPFLDAVTRIVQETFDDFSKADGLLRDLNTIGLQKTCDYLGIAFHYQICSQLDLDLAHVTHPGQWALEICDQLGADGYVNPPGGKELFRREEWEERKIDIAFTTLSDLRYEVDDRFRFEPRLSILDCMMWLPPDAIREFLDAQVLDLDL